MGRWSSSPTLVSESLVFSIHDLKKWGYIKPNIKVLNGNCTWKRNGEERASIGYNIETGATSGMITLFYKYRDENVVQKFPLVTVPSNLGKGLLWYFLCPTIGKKCRKLYSFKKYFAHREAFRNIFYESQITSKSVREFDKYCKIQHKAREAYETFLSKHFTPDYNGKQTKKAKKAYEAIRKAQNTKYDVTRAILGLPQIG